MSDGCNECSNCQHSNVWCSDVTCSTTTVPYCRVCDDGYELMNGYCRRSCLGFRQCAVYSDGCNTC